MKLLYHCSALEGGLAEYSRSQARALSGVANVEVLWQAPSSVKPPAGLCSIEPLNIATRKTGRSKLHRAWDFACDTLSSHSQLARAIECCHPDAVLLAAWSEYFAPLWVRQLERFKRSGISFGAVIHDPVRDYVRGPLWWHRLSVRKAYSFLDVAFTHDSETLDACGSLHTFRTVQIPHGPYPVPAGQADKSALRRDFGIPDDADVLLSFGHIRDGKNLEHIIAALPLLPVAHLLVAGREQSGGQRPVGFYRDLAWRLGVADRCHWHTNYIPNDEVWKYFRASDLLLLVYSQNFRSASGVLNVNAQFGLPVLASAGRSPLLAAVEQYGLGVVVPKLAARFIAEAVPQAMRAETEWVRFAAENSWAINAERVVEAFRKNAGKRKSC
jgi:glycosyltransferase involved in cell wall biosynthesis